MEKVQNMYWAKKSNYTFCVLHIEECKNTDNSYSIKISEYSGYVHNCGPTTPYIIRSTNTYKNISHEMRTLFYDELKGYHHISKENYDKIVELYDNYHKVFVETGRKIKKLIKKHRL